MLLNKLLIALAFICHIGVGAISLTVGGDADRACALQGKYFDASLEDCASCPAPSSNEQAQLHYLSVCAKHPVCCSYMHWSTDFTDAPASTKPVAEFKHGSTDVPEAPTSTKPVAAIKHWSTDDDISNTPPSAESGGDRQVEQIVIIVGPVVAGLVTLAVLTAVVVALLLRFYVNPEAGSGGDHGLRRADGGGEEDRQGLIGNREATVVNDIIYQSDPQVNHAGVYADNPTDSTDGTYERVD